MLAESQNFSSVSQQLESFGLLVDEDPTSRRIEFRTPPGFFLSIGNLLSIPSRRTRIPDRFYVANLDYLYPPEQGVNVPPVIANYFAAARLFALLSEVADHKPEFAGDSSLVLLGKGKLEVTSEYGEADLVALPDLDRFASEFISSQSHSKQKETIVRNAVLELFPDERKVRFGDLLGHFERFVLKVVASYELYVAEFSFDRVKAEVEKEKLEFTTKLNKVFADIQNQLLAVPAALILIGGQLDRVGTWTAKNTLIWTSALIFAILMDLLIRNQRNTLAAIKGEIDQQQIQIAGKYKAVASRFADTYRQLDSRHAHQERLISTVSTLVALALGVATWMYLTYSAPTEDQRSLGINVAAVLFAAGWLSMMASHLRRRLLSRSKRQAPG